MVAETYTKEDIDNAIDLEAEAMHDADFAEFLNAVKNFDPKEAMQWKEN